jgi:cytochrome P450
VTLFSRIAGRLLGPRPGPAREPGPGADSATIDLDHPAVTADPWPWYERLRTEGPVLFLPGSGAWIVLGYEETKAAFAQPDIFSNAPYAQVDEVLLAADPPGHESVRRLVARRFTNDMLGALAEFAEQRAPNLIESEIDAVTYAASLSHAVAARLIGFDDPTLAEIEEKSLVSLTRPDPLADRILFLDEMAPRSPLFAELIAGSGGSVGDREARSLIRLLWLAATSTTERVIARGALRLAEHPDIQQRIAADRALLPLFIDEVLRLHPPELMVPRLTGAPVTLGGADLPAGAFVHLAVAAAGRDPAAFEAPAEIRFDRPARRHFAFGSGIHHCVGAPLGRRIIAAAIGALLDAGRLRLLEPLESLPVYTSRTAQAPLRLPMAVEARDRLA